jgi:hypothetical protein
MTNSSHWLTLRTIRPASLDENTIWLGTDGGSSGRAIGPDCVHIGGTRFTGRALLAPLVPDLETPLCGRLIDDRSPWLDAPSSGVARSGVRSSRRNAGPSDSIVRQSAAATCSLSDSEITYRAPLVSLRTRNKNFNAVIRASVEAVSDRARSRT